MSIFIKYHVKFESSVISYGSQTLHKLGRLTLEFESSVISYGSQTQLIIHIQMI